MAESGANWLLLLATLITPLQIVVVDLLLSADNAVVIALACRGLPEEDARVATFFGTAGAVGLRLAMAAAAVALLHVPFLKLVAAVALLGVATKLTLSAGRGSSLSHSADGAESAAASLLQSIATIIAADAIMSLDNVVAVATLANGNLILLAFGLALSIPLLVWGSALIRRFLDENPVVVMLSGMYLGWLAGGIGVSDPAVVPWIDTNAPALPFVVPLACAIFVLWQTLILSSDRYVRRGQDVG